MTKTSKVTPPAPTDTNAIGPLAVGATRLAPMLDTSVRTVRGLDAGGKLPSPVRLGGSVRWVVSEIEEWLRAGAPDRATWETMKTQ